MLLLDSTTTYYQRTRPPNTRVHKRVLCYTTKRKAPLYCEELHAMLMLFFFIMPSAMSGLGNILLPIHISTPEMLYPKVNNLGVAQTDRCYALGAL